MANGFVVSEIVTVWGVSHKQCHFTLSTTLVGERRCEANPSITNLIGTFRYVLQAGSNWVSCCMIGVFNETTDKEQTSNRTRTRDHWLWLSGPFLGSWSLPAQLGVSRRDYCESSLWEYDNWHRNARESPFSVQCRSAILTNTIGETQKCSVQLPSDQLQPHNFVLVMVHLLKFFVQWLPRRSVSSHVTQSVLFLLHLLHLLLQLS